MDRKRAETVCAIEPDDLVLLSLARLTELRNEIDALSNDASGVLTHALQMREKEVTDAETYNGMIQVRRLELRDRSRLSLFCRTS